MCNECLVSGHQGHGCKKVNEFDATERADMIALINEAKHNFHQFDEVSFSDVIDTVYSSMSKAALFRSSTLFANWINQRESQAVGGAQASLRVPLPLRISHGTVSPGQPSFLKFLER